MKPEDKNQDKALNEDELDAVAGGLYGSAKPDPASTSPLAASAASVASAASAASVSACSLQNGNNGADVWAQNYK